MMNIKKLRNELIAMIIATLDLQSDEGAEEFTLMPLSGDQGTIEMEALGVAIELLKFEQLELAFAEREAVYWNDGTTVGAFVDGLLERAGLPVPSELASVFGLN